MDYKMVSKRFGQQPNETCTIQDDAGVGECVNPNKTITFFVAECMEIYSLGEYHEKLTVEKAVEIYNRIPSERRNAIKGIGVIIHLKGQPEYTDSHYDLMHLGKMDPDVLEYAGEDEPLVREAYQALVDCLKKKNTD